MEGVRCNSHVKFWENASSYGMTKSLGRCKEWHQE